jgi:hypothetical protein
LANLNVLAYREVGTSSGISLTDLGSGTYRLTDTLQRFDVVIYRLTGTPLTCVQAIAQNGASLKGDLNGDCYVNMKDFAILAEGWLQCINLQNASCL